VERHAGLIASPIKRKIAAIREGKRGLSLLGVGKEGGVSRSEWRISAEKDAEEGLFLKGMEGSPFGSFCRKKGRNAEKTLFQQRVGESRRGEGIGGKKGGGLRRGDSRRGGGHLRKKKKELASEEKMHKIFPRRQRGKRAGKGEMNISLRWRGKRYGQLDRKHRKG